MGVAIHETNEAIKKRPELTSELLKLRKRLETMKVASMELRSFRDDFERGNITTEAYQVGSKKLRMDVERARSEADLLTIVHEVKSEKEKSQLIRL